VAGALLGAGTVLLVWRLGRFLNPLVRGVRAIARLVLLA
jgi:hypothetical protein